VRLATNFILIVSGILAVTLSLSAYYFINSQNQLLEQQLHERGRVLGHLIALISPEAMLSYDYLRLNEYAREVSRQRDVVYGVIVNGSGAPLTSYINREDSEVKQSLDHLQLNTDTPLGPAQIDQLIGYLASSDNVLPMAFPIYHETRPLGELRVGLSRDHLIAMTRNQMLLQGAIYALIIVFLSVAIFWVFRYKVMQPVRQLMAASRNVGLGELVEVEVQSHDELGVLGKTFNAMIGEIREEQAKLQYQANYDALTSLPNRMLAIERLKQEVRAASRHNYLIAVMFIDLDDFKVVNDTMGHAIGDQLLIKMGGRLRRRLREGDTLARLGGDEFLVLLPEIRDIREVELVASRLLEGTSEKLLLDNREVIVHCSIGIAIYPSDGSSAEELMANADNAMYQAKKPGKAPVCFFTQEMNLRVRERLQLEQDLNRALERNELQLHLQPIFRASDSRLAGAEVLLRWQHPDKGPISPATFIPLAESTGQIVLIGEWVLRESMRLLRHWLDQGLAPGKLAVNISRVQLQERLVTTIQELIGRYRIPAGILELELTENILLDDQEQVRATLDRLQALGLKLNLDDFGTGYSSLSYLRRFSFDTLKVDRGFINGLPECRDSCSLIRAIIAMAHSLELSVVAEGVESPEQLEYLRQQGCDYLQGFLLGRPMPAEEYQTFLSRPLLLKEAVTLA